MGETGAVYLQLNVVSTYNQTAFRKQHILLPPIKSPQREITGTHRQSHQHKHKHKKRKSSKLAKLITVNQDADEFEVGDEKEEKKEEVKEVTSTTKKEKRHSHHKRRKHSKLLQKMQLKESVDDV